VWVLARTGRAGRLRDLQDPSWLDLLSANWILVTLGTLGLPGSGSRHPIMRWQMDEGSYARKLGRTLGGYSVPGNEAPPAAPPAPAVPGDASPAPPETAPACSPPPALIERRGFGD
jgi:hypothetical protein